MKRHQQILAGLVVVQLVLIAVVFWPRPATSGSGERAFPNLKAEDIVALRITDNQGASVYLRRGADGWVLPDAGDYPAQSQTIAPLLEKIVGLRSDRLVTRTEASHQRLQVASNSFVRRVTLELADGSFHILYLGSAPQHTTTHFRVEGRNETYLTSELTTWELSTRVASWINASYLSVPLDTLTEVTLENAQGRFTFVPVSGSAETTAREWTLVGLAEGETANATAIRTLVSRAASVVVQQPLGKEARPAYGLEQPRAVVTLKTDTETITLTVGAEHGTDGYVVKSSQSPYIVVASKFSMQDLVSQGRENFIVVPEPTATPEP